VLFIKRISETTQIMAVDERTDTEGAHHSLVGKVIPDGVLIFRVFGAFFFGAADKLETALNRAQQEPEILILRMRKVLAMDATGLNALEDLYEKLRKKGKHLILSGPHTQPYMTMDKSGFLAQLGGENVCPHIDAALDRARVILGLPAAPPDDEPNSQLEPAKEAPGFAVNPVNRPR
jgi:SulP family sulfate permease